MSRAFERTFTVAVPVERAWRAFADSHERSQWEASTYDIEPAVGGRIHWTLPGIEATGEVVEAVPDKLLRHVESSGPHAGSEVAVAFEEVGGGTRITITHSGFGDSEGWDEWLEGTTLGWTQAIADLVVYLETGVSARRFVTEMHSPGMTIRDVAAGVDVLTVEPGGLADQAGLTPGDLLLRVGGVPIFTIAELWVLIREHGPGTTFEIEYIRAGERHVGSGTLDGGFHD